MNLRDVLLKLKEKVGFAKTKETALKESISGELVVPTFEINVTENSGICKVTISDYITMVDYFEYMENNGYSKVEDDLCTSIIWDGGRQRVKKGTYYVFRYNGILYNIYNCEDFVEVVERIFVGKEISHKSFSYDIANNDYDYFSCMHDEFRSSYNTRYYSKNGTCIPNLELSIEEFLKQFNSLMSNLSIIEGIENMIDLGLLNGAVKLESEDKRLGKIIDSE